MVSPLCLIPPGGPALIISPSFLRHDAVQFAPESLERFDLVHSRERRYVLADLDCMFTVKIFAIFGRLEDRIERCLWVLIPVCLLMTGHGSPPPIRINERGDCHTVRQKPRFELHRDTEKYHLSRINAGTVERINYL